jgi:hypothetical protein
MVPRNEQEMREIMNGRCAKVRLEMELVPEGLSLTKTHISNFWYYREGNEIARLHERKADGHVCFELQEVNA